VALSTLCDHIEVVVVIFSWVSMVKVSMLGSLLTFKNSSLILYRDFFTIGYKTHCGLQTDLFITQFINVFFNLV